MSFDEATINGQAAGLLESEQDERTRVMSEPWTLEVGPDADPKPAPKNEPESPEAFRERIAKTWGYGDPEPAPKKHFAFTSWQREDDEDLVQMPRNLALDLIRMADVSPFLHELPDEALEKDLHYKAWEVHKERMGAITDQLVAHLCDEGLKPTDHLLLRVLVAAYEVSPKIALLEKARETRDAQPQERD